MCSRFAMKGVSLNVDRRDAKRRRSRRATCNFSSKAAIFKPKGWNAVSDANLFRDHSPTTMNSLIPKVFWNRSRGDLAQVV